MDGVEEVTPEIQLYVKQTLLIVRYPTAAKELKALYMQQMGLGDARFY